MTLPAVHHFTSLLATFSIHPLMESSRSSSRDERQVGGGHGYQLLMRSSPWSSSCYSWPAAAQRSSSSYTCGYCKREFRSAQALGGHMNVHRRERARLRHHYYYHHHQHYCSSSTPTAAAALPRPPPLPLPNLNLSPAPAAMADAGDGRRPAAIYSFFSTATDKLAGLEVNLELGVGGFSTSSSSDGGGELDLELRLGCS